jgi:hypothetical protein
MIPCRHSSIITKDDGEPTWFTSVVVHGLNQAEPVLLGALSHSKRAKPRAGIIPH